MKFYEIYTLYKIILEDRLLITNHEEFERKNHELLQGRENLRNPL
jgi:hypothetical protein